MKNRQAAILTGMFLCMAAVTGCGSNTETQAAKQQGSEIEDTAAENTAAEGDDEKTDGKTGKTEEQNKENQIFGKIVSVSEDSITISVESAPVNGTEDGKENSGTEETGEEQTIALTENTVIRKQTMGQPGGEAPEMPEGEAPENGGASEQPEEVSENGGTSEQPEKPEGEAPAQEAGEEIVWSDLKEGDMAVIILDEDGNQSASWKEIWGSREMTSHSGRKNIRQRPHILMALRQPTLKQPILRRTTLKQMTMRRTMLRQKAKSRSLKG